MFGLVPQQYSRLSFDLHSVQVQQMKHAGNAALACMTRTSRHVHELAGKRKTIISNKLQPCIAMAINWCPTQYQDLAKLHFKYARCFC